MHSQHAFGFSLLELMIVVAIIGILAIIAIPSYQDYAKRARFADVIGAAQRYKTAIAIAIQQGTSFKELKLGEHGIPRAPTPNHNLASITVKNGVVTAIGTDLVNKATYILRPDEDGGQWSVGGTCLSLGWCHD